MNRDIICMVQETFIYTGSAILALWGIAHIIPVRSVIAGFGDIPVASRRIITMEWIAGGLTFVFIGALDTIVTYAGNSSSHDAFLVYSASGVMCIVLAALGILTGARSGIIPMRMCPWVTAFAALLLLAGAMK